jgi:predicted nucleotidyltransferase
MNLANPINSVIPGGHGVVQTILARTDRPLTGRRVAELAAGQLGQSRVNEVLGELAQAGIVAAEAHPPAKLYTLNRSHVAADAVVALTDLRGQLVARIRAALAVWRPAPDSAWLFDSAARGDGDATSDIDVLVVRPDTVDGDDPGWLSQLAALGARMREWSGNEASVIEYAARDFAELARSGERLVDEIRRDGIRLACSPRVDRVGARRA